MKKIDLIGITLTMLLAAASVTGYAQTAAKQHTIDSLVSQGETLYKAKDRKCIDYFIKAYMAGDTAQRLFRMLHVAEEGNWALDIPRTAKTVDSLKQVIENNPDSLLPLQQYIFVLGGAAANDTITQQINAWMKQFPASAAIPLALGESYYEAENPKASPYLLKVVALQPKNARVWSMLDIDAQRWGNNDLAREYIGKAAAAAPDDPEYAFSYADAFLDKDTAMFRKLIWDLVKRFPDSDKGASALFWLAYNTRGRQEKIKVYEQLRDLYPPATFEVAGVQMNRLFDLYLQEGLMDKAVSLATAMGEQEGWPEKLQLAKNIATVHVLAKQKDYTRAQEKIAQIKLSRYSDAVNTVALLKAEVRDAAGSTQMAYDSLLLIQAKAPDDNIRDAITKYGTKLGRSSEQIEKDVWVLRDKVTKPAPAFELGLYTSNGKTRLEDYRGKVVLLTFWFPGCGPCRGEMPHFQKVVNKYNKKDLAYLGINVLPEQDDYVLPFMRGTRYSFTPLHDNNKWAEKAYHVRGEPSNFLIDKEGNIVYSDFMINGDNERMLELMINSLLAKG